MKLLALLVLLITINNILGDTSATTNDGNNAFTIPLPRVCLVSKKQIYTNLIKRSNRNFVSAYQRFMPKECNYSFEVVRIVEAYRNAANYVVIFLNKQDSTVEQFNEVVSLYDSALNQFKESIREMTGTKRLTNSCYNSLMLMQRAIVTTGEGLVTGTMVTYNTDCPSTRVRNTFDRPAVPMISNYLI